MSPGVGALLVEVAQVALEVPAERGEVWHERAREGRTPALFEDRALRPLDAAVALRTPGGNEPLRGAQVADRLAEARMDELVAVVGGHRAQPPARRLKFRRGAAQDRHAVVVSRVGRGDVQLRPEESRDDVGRRVLPGFAFGPGEAADMETVELQHIAGPIGGDVALLGERPLRLGWRGVPGDQRPTLPSRLQPGPPQHVEDTAGAHLLAAAAHDLRGDASRTQTGLTEGRGNDLLLKPARDL